ncbi:30S ribosomal protein S17 [Tepiditoga spiralis]|uniref:Small ribosomal subunit protein uS17 n=1 Tax=Tepiditoga spiralis TaxID=2108365 RepID=A0A7G1G496_9BACT|nr:30S ribosomal protein S17 [Tepiditoga spiralis]BBE30905.1 30S ribosomal protein S17 [Tepiditoga spiralis]
MPRKVIVGTVISDKMDKTVTVEVKDFVKHPVYKKTIKRTKKYHAHDENNACKMGDIVEIEESRKYSKTTNFVVTKILNETPEAVEENGGEN